MTHDEHRNIIAFIDGAVRQEENLLRQPLDVEADAIIRALFVRNPEAAYRVTMLALAQRETVSQLRSELAEAKARLRDNWFTRLLKKSGDRTPRQSANRQDPDFALLPRRTS